MTVGKIHGSGGAIEKIESRASPSESKERITADPDHLAALALSGALPESQARPILEATLGQRPTDKKERERLWDVASMLEFQAKTALNNGKRNIEIDAEMIVPQIVAVMRAAAGQETPVSASVPHGKVLVDVQLIRDIQSNAAIGEPEWSSIEDRLLRIGAPDRTSADKGQG